MLSYAQIIIQQENKGRTYCDLSPPTQYSSCVPENIGIYVEVYIW